MNELNDDRIVFDDIKVVFSANALILKLFWVWCSHQGIIFSYDKPDIDDEMRCAVKAFSNHILYELIDLFDIDQKEGEVNDMGN